MMTRNDTDSSYRRLVAVSLALIMLVSAGSAAFVGSVSAQATGGTYDQVFDDRNDVSDDLNIDYSNDVELVAGDDNVSNVNAASDGRIEIGGGDETTGEFRGAALSADRVSNVTGTTLNDGELATFLDNVPSEFNISTNSSVGDSTPAVFIELDPQSEPSQINKTERVDGTHDFIVVAPANTSTNTLGADDQLNGTVDTNLNASSNGDINKGDIVALSVDNDEVLSGDADSSLLASANNFGSVFDTLVGSSESDLQDKNVDQVEFAAGTFDQHNVAVHEVQIADDLDNLPAGETVHSEKIELDDADADTAFFSSISEAVDNSSDSDTITVDYGNYSVLEGQNVTVDTAATIQTTDRVDDRPTIDRVDTTNTSLATPANETIINTSLEVDDGASISGVVVENGTEAAVNITNGSASLTNSIVNYTATTDAVNVTASGAELADSTVMAHNATQFESGEVGLELNNDNAGTNIEDNYFVGFETQVANVSSEGNADALFDNHTDEFEDAQAQSAVPFRGGSVNATSLYGSINASDAAVDNGTVINVSAGTYDEGGNLVVATDDIEVTGASDAVIENPTFLNSSTQTTLTNFEVNGSVTAVDDNNGGSDVTVDNVDLTGSDRNVTIKQGDTVAVQDVTVADAGVDAINVSAGLSGSLTVDNVDVYNLTDGTGVRSPSVGDDLTVTDVNVDANVTSSGADGLNFSDIGSSGTINISENSLTGLANGTALAINESSGSAESLDIDGNEFRSGQNGTNFVGIEYNLPDTPGANITDNTIVGADVKGGQNSTGIDLVNVTVSSVQTGEGVTERDDETTVTTEYLTVENNDITGFARVINSQDSDVISADYDAFVNNNNFGTYVTGPGDGATGTYEDTYGLKNSSDPSPAIDELGLSGSTDSYLPGSVSEAIDLVNSSQQAGFADFRNRADDTYTPELVVYNPDISVNGPNSYDEPGPVVIPDIRQVTISGEGTDATPTVESRIVINSSDAINNHTIRNLAINNTDNSEPAINLTDGHNSQSTFENLAVESDDSGVVVGATETDVNVIEIRNSEFNVSADGIVLADGADDRDGFVIHDTDVTGPGIDQGDNVGLNLSQVDKPGKEDPDLDTELTVTENYVAGFETQVLTPGSTATTGTQITALNFTSEQFGDEFDLNNDPSIDIDENEFGQQVLVFENSSDPQDVSNENVSLAGTNNASLYGSIQAAHDNVDADNDIVRVYDVTELYADDQDGTPSGGYYDDGVTEYNEDLTIDETNITVRGPAFDSGPADVDFRSADALINGTVEFDGVGDGTNASAEFTGFTVVADDNNGNVTKVTGTTGNLTIANTAVSAFGNSSLNIPESEINGTYVAGTSTVENETLTLDGVFVGDHDEVETINSSVVVDNSSTNLSIIDSTLTSDTDTTEGVGLEYVSDGGDATVTDTEISNHGQEGINASNVVANVTVTDGSTIEQNAGDGFNASAAASSTIVVEDSTSVTNNDENGTGILVNNASAATLTVENATVSGHDTGIAVQNATDTSSITVSTVESNTEGLLVNATNVDLGVTGNSFNNTNLDINETDGSTLNASLNYFGDRKGPATADTAGVTSSVVYDPFLTEDKTGQPVSTVEQTTEFSHDVIIHGNNNVTTVGFPAQPVHSGQLEDGEEPEIQDFIDTDEIEGVYGFNSTSEQFEGVDPDTTVEAFDAFAVSTNGSQDDAAMSITYDGQSVNTEIARYEFEEGLNFVPATAVGPANETLIASQYSDAVVQPFKLPGNLYGDNGQTNASFAESTSTPRQVIENSSDFGAVTVHPHAGYLVVVNNDESVEFTQTEEITKPAPVTADTVAERTNQTAP